MRLLLSSGWLSNHTRLQVADKRRFSGEFADDVERLQTPGGMTDPAARSGRSADGADLASTDMSQEPSSREDSTQAEFGGGLPAEPSSEAIRRLEQQLDEARDQHLRLAAEYENYRKRATRERTELNDRAQAALAGRLLDALDDMDRLSADMGTISPDCDRTYTLPRSSGFMRYCGSACNCTR